MTNPVPSPIDVADFQFKLQCRLNIFQNESAEEFNKVCSLVACASRYGLIFVGTKSNSFQVIQVQQIETFEKDVSNYTRRTIDLPSRPLNISANCDSTKLSVIVEKDGCATAIIFDILSFFKQNITVLKEIRLSATPGVNVLETDWNPALPDIFTACKDDGSLGVYEFKGPALDIHELPGTAGSTCFCWSPKGKQIAVGSRDGKITQYKPDLKAVKAVNPPPLSTPHSIISLKWISSFQFIGVYNDGNQNSQSLLIVVDAPKAGNPVYTNYEDICYSYGNTRPQQFYMLLQQHWNILMVSSTNSMEVGVIGLTSDKWMQWILGDSCRAELPLSASKQDTLPLGATINTGATVSPSLFVLSHHGVLCCFNILNSRPGAPSVCSPPEPVADKSGLHLFIQGASEPKIDVPKVQQQPPIQIAPTTIPNITNPQTITPPIVKPLFAPTTPLFGTPPTNQNLPATGLFGKPLQQPQTTLSFGIAPAQKIQTPLAQLPIQTIPLPKPQENIVKPSLSLQQPTELIIKPKVTQSEKEQQTPSKRKVDGRIPVNVETEAMIAQLVRDECITLESELKVLLHRCRSIKINIGNDTDATGMAKKANSLEEFLKALKETSTSQEAEIHSLKQSVIQTWAWYEEARSRYNSSQDPKLISLLQAQPLDPASKRQLEEINHLIYYLDSQLIQANKSLDEQWDTFQDSLSKNTKIQMPTMDAIYQSILKQNSTIQKQKYILKYISSRIKTYNKNQTNSNILISLDKADNLEEELNKLQICPDVIPHLQYKKVLEQQQKFKEEKSQKLFKFLQKRNVTHISVSKPQLNDSTIHLSTLLAEPLSPIAPNKKLQPTKIDFVMSTPKVQEKLIFEPKKDTEQVVINRIVPPAEQKINNLGTTSTPFPKQIPTKPSFGVSMLPGASTTATFPTAPALSFSSTNIAQSSSKIDSSTSQPNISASAQNTFGLNKGAFTVSTTQVKPFSSTQNVTSKPSMFGSLSTSVQSTQGETSPKVLLQIPKYTAATTVATSAFSKSAASNVFVAITKPSTSLFGNVSSSTLPAMTKTPLFGDTSSGVTITPSPTTTKAIFSFTPEASVATPTCTVSTKTPSTTIITSSTGTTPKTSLFGTQSTVESKSTTIFGSKLPAMFGGSTTATALPTTTSTMFDTTKSGSLFGASSGGSLFGNSSMFGGTQTISTTSESSNVATATSSISTTSANKSIFGNSATSGVVSTAAPASVTSTTPNTTAATTNTATSSIFGSSNLSTAITTSTTSTPSSTESIFGTSTATNTNIFGTKVTTTASSGNFFGSTSIFASTAATTTQSSIFASTATSFASKPTSVFDGTPAITQASSIGNTVQPSEFPNSPTTSVPSIFGGNSTTAQASVFGSAPATTQTSVFGGSSTTTQSSVFKATPTTAPPAFAATPTTATSVFGATPTTAPPAFAATPTTAQSVFGSTTTTAQSVFGASQPSTTSTAFGGTTSPFGGSPFGTNNQSSASSTFGATSPFATSATSPFGSGSTFGAVSSSSGSIFGQPTTFGGGSIFGGNTTTTSSSVFGGNASAFNSNSNVFGNTPTTSTPFGGSSVFGAAVTSSTPFGGASVTSSSPFGGASVTSSTPFGSASVTSSTPFGGAAVTSSTPFGGTTAGPFAQPAQTSFSNSGSSFGAFGGNTGNANSFGFNSLNVGATTTTSSSSGFGSGFGQTNPFGRTASQEQKSPFAQSGGSLFGTPTTSTTSVFGGNSPFNKTAAPAFGSPPAFGTASTFGAQSPAAPFGQASSFSGGFGSPAQQGSFSATGQTVQQSGFGSPAFQKTNTGFGSAPVFGSPTSPGFGATPSFGTSPAFGSSATFGSPQKVFGGQTTESSSNFGNMAQNSNFGNLANQNTVGFGNLAQQAGSPAAQQPSGFSGGSSFSSWR